MRHRLVHGYRSANPKLIEQAIQFLDRVLIHQERIFGKLEIPLRNTDKSTTVKFVMLGNVLAQRPAAGRGINIQGGERESLMKQFNLGKNKQPARLPDTPVIRRLEKAVGLLG